MINVLQSNDVDFYRICVFILVFQVFTNNILVYITKLLKLSGSFCNVGILLVAKEDGFFCPLSISMDQKFSSNS